MKTFDTQGRMALQSKSQWPYPVRVYLRRLLWSLMWHTVWQVSWKRIYGLRPAILRAFGATTGRLAGIAGSARIAMPWQLELGEQATLGERVQIYNLATAHIGSRTILSQDVYVCGGTHDYTDLSFPLQRKTVHIGDDVWVGAGAFVGPGVHIGDGAVIGARAVVVHDVEPWTVVAGNPAKFIKRRELKEHPKCP